MTDRETIAFRMVLNSGMAEEYRRRHDEIWPDLLVALREAGVVDYRIFLDPGTHHLFAVLTRRRESHRMAALRDAPVMRRWWAMMADIMQTNEDASPREVPLAEMFCLNF